GAVGAAGCGAGVPVREPRHRDRRDPRAPARADLRLPVRHAAHRAAAHPGRRAPPAHRPRPVRRRAGRRAEGGHPHRAGGHALHGVRPGRSPLARRGPPRAAPARPRLHRPRRGGARRARGAVPRPAAPVRGVLRRGPAPAVHRGVAPRDRAHPARPQAAAPAAVLPAPGARETQVPRRLGVGGRCLDQRRAAGADRAAAAGGRIVRTFAELYGREPDGRWAGPGRVNLIGEHVDYADGLCLPFAIAQRTVVEVARRDDDRLRLRSLSEDGGFDGDLADVGPGRPEGWSGYVAGVLWALREAGYRVGGIDVLVTDTVPLGSGLSSSAALECAVAIAVDDLYGLGLGGSPEGRKVLVDACRRAENDVVGAQTGGMDQAASLLGTAGHALLLDTRDGSTRQVPFAPAEVGLTLLVIDTKVRHSHAGGEYGARRASVEKAAAVLGRSLRDVTVADLAALDADLLPRARHVVTEID